MYNLQNQDSPATSLQGFDAIEFSYLTVDGASLKGYRLQDFQDVCERYAGPLATARDRKKLGRGQLTPLNSIASATSRPSGNKSGKAPILVT